MLAQGVVILIMIYGDGQQLFDIGDPFGAGIISTGPFTLIFTTLVALTMINSYNFGDDGGAYRLSGDRRLFDIQFPDAFESPGTIIHGRCWQYVAGFYSRLDNA